MKQFYTTVFGLITVTLFHGLSTDSLAQTTATWIGNGGDGNYSTAANWSTNQVPVNNGNTYNVVIPTGFTVDFDLATPSTVTGLELESGSTLNINNGRSLTVDDAAVISGLLQTVGGTFSAPNLAAKFDGNAAQIIASGGGNITHAAASYDGRGIARGDIFKAEGAGTVLDLSSLTSIDNLATASFTNIRAISALNGATLDLSNVTTLQGGGDSNDRLDLVVSGTDSVLDLSSLQSIPAGNVQFVVDVGTYSLPSLESVVNTSFSMSPGTVLNLPSLTSFSNRTLEVSANGTINVDVLTTMTSSSIVIGTGGTLNASNLDTFTNSTLTLGADQTLNVGPLSDIDNTRLIVSGGKSLAISDTIYDGRGIARGDIFKAEGTGTVLDLSSLTSIDNLATASFTNIRAISALNGATLDLSNVTTLQGGGDSNDRLDLVVSGTDSVLDLSSLQSIPAGNVQFVVDVGTYSLPSLESVVNTSFSMSPGTVLNLPSLTSFSNRTLEVSANGTINVDVLTTMTSSSIVIGTGGTLNASNLDTFTNSTLTLGADQTLNVGPLSDIDNTRLIVSGGKSLAISDTIYDGRGIARGDIFKAEGAGTVLDLSSLTSIDNLATASFTNIRAISALNGATLDLSNVTTLQGGGDSNDRLDLVVSGTDSVLDLSSLQSIPAGNVRFDASGGGTLKLGDMTATSALAIELDDPDTTLDVSGSLLLQAGSRFNATGAVKVQIGDHFTFDHTDETLFTADSAIFHFDGTDTQFLEVGGMDIGLPEDETLVTGNFALGQLIVGQDDQATMLQLLDVIDNGNRSSPEALYLNGLGGPDGLQILGDSTLIIDNIDVYATQNGDWIHINSLFGPGESLIAFDDGFIRLPEPTTLSILLMGVVSLTRRRTA